MDNKGQLSAEYLLLAGVLIILVMLAIVFVASENELNMAMSAARNGAIEGIGTSSLALYPSKSSLLHPYSVDIVNVSYVDMGMDKNYNKKKIQFKVYAKTSNEYSKSELDSIGDRINYNLRKSIAICFNSNSSTNKLYNPVFSPHYVFTTANIKWV